MKKFILAAALLSAYCLVMAQPEIPVEEWTGKTILLIGAHPMTIHTPWGPWAC
jgi:hypothetical protein